jgi:flagellar biosynthesis/type III secretory pathway M-ring protein FliF/YscJ
MAEEITEASNNEEVTKAAEMPPVKSGGAGGRGLYIIGAVIFIAVVAFLLFYFKANLMPSDPNKAAAVSSSKYVRVFTNLALKEAAEVRAILEAQGIKDYRIEDKGKSISVRRKEADNVRLIMALEGLPSGGVIGYEIFDKGGALGATDFDKKIKLTRALNGELSRNISRIDRIVEARVQIVIPEKSMFETVKVPVTAAIFIKITKGLMLTPMQVRGVVNLVASSVEELSTSNVMVVDYSGNILTSLEYADIYEQWADEQEKEFEKMKMASYQKGKDKKRGFLSFNRDDDSGQAAKVEPKKTPEGKGAKKVTTPREMMEARLGFKKKYEKDLEKKGQAILDQFFPMDQTMIRVNAELKTFDESQENDESAVARLTAIILLDDKSKDIVLTPEVKETVFKAVAAVVGYVRGRDRLDLRWAPVAKVERTVKTPIVKAEMMKELKELKKQDKAEQNFGQNIKDSLFKTFVGITELIRKEDAAKDIVTGKGKKTLPKNVYAQMDAKKQKTFAKAPQHFIVKMIRTIDPAYKYLSVNKLILLNELLQENAFSFYAILLIALVVIYSLIKKIFKRKKKVKGEGILAAGGSEKSEQSATLDDFRDTALKNPDKLADVLKNWLTE